jgi:hypothetical protein
LNVCWNTCRYRQLFQIYRVMFIEFS